ncbi:HET-domain-containing protein, partial [Trametes versicolor FP-101664 SS1]|uniref:HET-domain-containing protein n=1 Tax=Trametes versicolor (strain FP-101664) TaxID=717944 RepID=UPI0004621908
DDNAAPYIILRSPLLEVGSPRALALAKECIDECVQRHKSCMSSNLPDSRRLPTHVIDCTNLAHPRLVSTDGRSGKYLTLSYVWGLDQIHKTTTSNVSQYECGIDLSLLPATIRDAIYVTHALGLQFLWVDSLCIIQDSNEDKRHEIRRMHHIYRHSHLTIIAASA